LFVEDKIGLMIGMCNKLREHLRNWPLDQGGPYEYDLIGHPTHKFKTRDSVLTPQGETMSETMNKIWGLVHVGPTTFIGAFRDYPIVADGAVVPTGEVGERLLRGAIYAIEADFEKGKTVYLEPALELQAPLRQVRQMTPKGEREGVSKAPLPMPYGFTTGGITLRVLRPSAYTFINEMSSEDQKIYRGFIETVFKAELEERAARAGLALVDAGEGIRG
jgi:hypothetical protein